ncbi:hypothetical protein PFLUV_G00041350 [Perca fluviatilis]|uniref:Tankyrase 1-binding protein C-terminal domain-containing protein n=1 Tax=Perca fluviatilis TaxID=8168 RepID=A0A6A5FLF5_PERFL|nr:hypothetical protein PFLUV_G00041350 [Perca fluviatilis]
MESDHGESLTPRAEWLDLRRAEGSARWVYRSSLTSYQSDSVMESSFEISQTGGTSNPKPSLAPKPRLTPKPFSLQKNTTIRSIHAPKRVAVTSKTTTQQTGKSEASGVPKPSVSTPAQKLPQQTTTSDSKPSSVSVLTKDKPKPTKESKASPYGEDTLDSSVGKSDPASRTAPPKETPKSEPIQRDDVIQANHKASTDIVNSEQIDGKKTEDITQTSMVQTVEESGSDVSSTDNPAYRWGNSRKRLSMKLTSKFESAGSLPPQPSVTVSTTSTKDDAHKPESSDPEPNQTTSEPSNDEGALKEDYRGGGSIKRRISLLFDSSSRPEAMTKREEPEIINGTGVVKGVKERIKTWATETIPEGPKTEKKPQVAPRTRSKSQEPPTAPTGEKTTKIPPVEPQSTETSASQAVDLPSKVSPAEQPTETPMETSKEALAEVKPSENLRETLGEPLQNKSTEGGVQLRNHSSFTTPAATDEGDSAASESAQLAPKRNDVKRRSVRFGIVERDDGGPPLILGSASDSSEEEEEEEASGDEAEEDIPVPVPVYKRVGGLQKKDADEVQEQEKERLKHLEFEKRRRAKENEQAGLKKRAQLEEELRLEDERKREERESAGPNLISFDSEDVPRKSEWPYSPLVKAYETGESQVEVVYDDFSVKPPLLKVDFDDFSVKPKRWGSQAKVETSPLIQSRPAVPADKEEVEVVAPLEVSPLESKVPEQVEKPGSPKPTLAQKRPEEEQLISMEVGEKGEEEEEDEEEETRREEEEETMEDEVDEGDEQEAPVNSTNDEDTDALIDNEPDQQNEACEQTSEIDSPKPVPDQVPEVPSEDVDTIDFYREPELAPFPESSTPLLDTSVQKSKADLGRRRTRTRQSRSLHGGLAPKESPDWRTCDSTDEKETSSKQRESDSDEEQPKPKMVCSPPPTSQRVPMFPGLSPAALIAQLKKRTGGGETRGREEIEEDKGREEKESQNEEAAPSPSQRSRSTRSAAHLAGAARVLPPLGGTDAGAVSSPAWLKELKSKKRLSQYDSEA